MLYPGRTLIFTNSIDCIKRLQSILAILKRSPLPLHAQMEQKQRLTNLEKFSSTRENNGIYQLSNFDFFQCLDSENGVLVATDVAARGLDIPNIKHIIHYQVPRSTEVRPHRSVLPEVTVVVFVRSSTSIGVVEQLVLIGKV